MEIGEHWEEIRTLFRQALATCHHCALATVGEDGSPHVTPIGSLILRADRTGFYFEEFPTTTPRNLAHDQRVCVLAVNSGGWFWFKSLWRGAFASPPAVRLLGTAGERRAATAEEIAAWQKIVKPARRLKGYDLLWRNMGTIREIHFDAFEPVRTGAMTRGLWTLP